MQENTTKTIINRVSTVILCKKSQKLYNGKPSYYGSYKKGTAEWEKITYAQEGNTIVYFSPTSYNKTVLYKASNEAGDITWKIKRATAVEPNCELFIDLIPDAKTGEKQLRIIERYSEELPSDSVELPLF